MRSPTALLLARPCALWGRLSATRKAALKVSGSLWLAAGSEALNWRRVSCYVVASWGLSDCAGGDLLELALARTLASLSGRAVSSSRGEVLLRF